MADDTETDWPDDDPEIPAESYADRRRAPWRRPAEVSLTRPADHRPTAPTLVAPEMAQVGDLIHGLAQVNWPSDPATWPRPGQRRAFGPGLFECVILPDQNGVFWRRVG